MFLIKLANKINQQNCKNLININIEQQLQLHWDRQGCRKPPQAGSETAVHQWYKHNVHDVPKLSNLLARNCI